MIKSLFKLYRGLSCFNTLQTLTSTLLFLTMKYESKKYLLLGLIFLLQWSYCSSKNTASILQMQMCKCLKVQVNWKKTKLIPTTKVT